MNPDDHKKDPESTLTPIPSDHPNETREKVGAKGEVREHLRASKLEIS